MVASQGTWCAPPSCPLPRPFLPRQPRRRRELPKAHRPRKGATAEEAVFPLAVAPTVPEKGPGVVCRPACLLVLADRVAAEAVAVVVVTKEEGKTARLLMTKLAGNGRNVVGRSMVEGVVEVARPTTRTHRTMMPRTAVPPSR